MATVKRYQTPSGATYWEVRYRTPERGTTRKRGFKTKRDAEAHATKLPINENTIGPGRWE